MNFILHKNEQKRRFRGMKFQCYLAGSGGISGASVDQSESFDVGDAAGNRLPEPGVMPLSKNSADFNH